MQATSRVILVSDLAGFHRAFENCSDAEMAAFLEGYYALVCGAVEEAGGRVVKLIGDAVLATFPAEAAAEALGVAVDLEGEVEALANKGGMAVDLGAHLHLGTVLEGELGYGNQRRWDVVGRMVNETFLLGRGAGVRISKEVQGALPESERSFWRESAANSRVFTRSGPTAPGSPSSSN